MEMAWDLTFAAAYVVDPGRGCTVEEVEQRIRGSRTEIEAFPMEFFRPLFEQNLDSWPIDVLFTTQDGNQENAVRTQIRRLAFPSDREEATAAAKDLAGRLCRATRKNSKQGLLVILVGQLGNENAWKARIVLWKFPSDISLQADLSADVIGLQVREAFSAGSTFAKAAMFEGTPAETSFWTGYVEDKQTKQSPVEVRKFWVEEFLGAELSMTGVRGTQLLSRTLRALTRQSDLSSDAKERVIASAVLAKNLVRQVISFQDFADSYLPPEVGDSFIQAIGGPRVARMAFEVDGDVLDRETGYKTLSLENGFMIRGPLSQFDDVVKVTPTSDDGSVTISIQGVIASETLQKGPIPRQLRQA